VTLCPRFEFSLYNTPRRPAIGALPWQFGIPIRLRIGSLSRGAGGPA
jgi:hypothetical protein